jgi:uncharacterized protein
MANSDSPFEFASPEGLVLRGTLMLPDAPGPSPAALLLSGSGPLDRDSNMPGQVLDVSKTFAEALADRGIASLRYDKRGVERSEGEYLRTGFEEETADARAALGALAAHSDVDGLRLAVVGHSVGGTIAVRLAAERSDLAAIVVLAAAARRGEEVMARQSEMIAASLRGSRLWGRLLLRKQARARNRILASTRDVARVGLQRLPARWFREFIAYDPRPDLSKIACPVLAITGAEDVQADPADVAEIGRLARAPFTGSTPEGIGHLLRRTEGVPGLAGYQVQMKQPVDAQLVEEVARWLLQRLAGSERA